MIGNAQARSRSRLGGTFDRAELHRILDRLLDVRELTDPTKESDPSELRLNDAKGKAELADWSLTMGIMLAAEASGWAFDFEIGRIVDPRDNRDDHAHEAAGNAYPYDPESPASVRMARKIMWGLTHHLWPFSQLFTELANALDALEHGAGPTNESELSYRFPFLVPVENNRRGWAAAQFQIIAVEYACFLQAQGIPLGEAQETVAVAFGCKAEGDKPGRTIANWEKALERDFPVDTKKVIECARAAGELKKKAAEDPGFWDRWRAGEFALDGATKDAFERLEATDIDREGDAYLTFLFKAKKARS
jgi:hypothetical protein